jgi:hypothetical protein
MAETLQTGFKREILTHEELLTAGDRPALVPQWTAARTVAEGHDHDAAENLCISVRYRH